MLQTIRDRRHQHGPRPSDEELEKLRTLLPSTNCVRCGARGYCRHRPAPWGVSHGAGGAA